MIQPVPLLLPVGEIAAGGSAIETEALLLALFPAAMLQLKLMAVLLPTKYEEGASFVTTRSPDNSSSQLADARKSMISGLSSVISADASLVIDDGAVIVGGVVSATAIAPGSRILALARPSRSFGPPS
ncbi:MAG: hypothetical protein JJ956_05740 [Pseudomonadales bacterium]|nr:hypothetical protein [Pseudomonadales bacterium]